MFLDPSIYPPSTKVRIQLGWKFAPEESSEVILKIGAEGGSNTLNGIPHGTEWRYFTSVNESVLSGEFDELGSRRDPGCVDSWDAALRLVDRYPWHRLYAVAVHPQFKERVWSALSSGLPLIKDCAIIVLLSAGASSVQTS
jgi:hypothetical protein